MRNLNWLTWSSSLVFKHGLEWRVEIKLDDGWGVRIFRGTVYCIIIFNIIIQCSSAVSSLKSQVKSNSQASIKSQVSSLKFLMGVRTSETYARYRTSKACYPSGLLDFWAPDFRASTVISDFRPDGTARSGGGLRPRAARTDCSWHGMLWGGSRGERCPFPPFRMMDLSTI